MVPTLPVMNLPVDVVLLDVREDDEWEAGHAPQAVHVPMGEVPRRLDQIADAFPDPPVHVVCRSGKRSSQVTAFLVGVGMDAVNVDGGMQAWKAAGRPLVAESSTAPTVL